VIIRVDTDAAVVEVEEAGGTRSIRFSDPEAFALVSKAWLRTGWEARYSYRFTWLGRPIIQLPEDVIRLQEAVMRTRPDVIVETGIAHGGSLVLYASLCELLGHGHVVGVDVEIRPANRAALEGHALSPLITLVEGSSIDPATFAQVRDAVGAADRVLVVLDSDHSREHVLEELRLYSTLVPVGSLIVAADGSIMRDVVSAPQAKPDWEWDNPLGAVDDFLAEQEGFVREDPAPLFDESRVQGDVTYSAGGWLRRVR
jgi:cephalosporin hydroxylase